MTNRHTTFIIAALFIAAALSFGCSDSGTDETTPPGPSPSVGAEGGACTAEGTCNTGLSCSAETKLCLKVIVTCEGEGVCPDGYECKDNKCVSTGPKAGDEGGACLPENTCSGTLACKASVCSKCTADADCGSGKVCSSGACGVKPCPDGMVLIPGGQFKMGSETGDSDEKPIHDVTVSDFCMDENEFTNKKKDELKTAFPTLGAIDGSGKSIGWDNLVTTYTPANFYSNDHPLIGVSWYVAKRICELQSKQLPTEAEWEYAARGGTQAEYGTKDGVAPTKDNACWSCENTACKKTTTCNVKAYPPPNAYGLYDMSGNVWEWAEDYYNAYPGANEIYWKNVKKDYYRVLRGGSWYFTDPDLLRAALRGFDVPSVRDDFIGFRCVVVPQDSTE